MDYSQALERTDTPFVILRHDIDFCPESALIMALVEAELDVRSTYFFQLRSPLYNVLSTHSASILSQIYQLGHTVALHFDLNAYVPPFIQDLERDLRVFSNYFAFATTDIVSIHLAGKNKSYLKDLLLPQSIRHTYEGIYCSNIYYSSDSTGRWRFGCPVETEAFLERRSIQLLTHPLWWVYPGRDDEPLSKLHSFLESVRDQMITYIEDTAVTFPVTSLRYSLSQEQPTMHSIAVDGLNE